ncbi:MAG: DNA primase [bacterium]|nr:DNA primase [bacterium]
MLAQSTIEQVKAYTDIVFVISEYVSLIKKGRNYLGLCPFHTEKTPSFTVSPEKKIWHCFGCHESGDLISFIMKIDNLSFAEAIRHIADKGGIEIIEETSNKTLSTKDKNRESIQEMIFLAKELFKQELKEGSAPFNYLIQRGLTKDTILKFNIGYCPPDTNLESYLLNKGFDYELIKKTGLFFKNNSGKTVLRFQGRVIFPVIDYRGKTVGFGGRIIVDNPKTAKYINSEENFLFNKRKLLYALESAKSSIRKTGSIILMEGYMDTVISHQYGFTNAVATMGTAITPHHAQKIKRFASKVYLAMDSDSAGQSSIEKSFDVLKQYNLKVHIIQFKEKDPADILIMKGSDFFKQCIKSAIPFIDFNLNRSIKAYPPDNINNIPRILDAVIPVLRLEPDIIIQRHYISKISKKINIDEELIMAKLKKNRYNIRKEFIFVQKNKKNKYQKAEEFLILLMSSQLALRTKILENINTDDFITPVNAGLVKFIADQTVTDNDLLTELTDEELRKELSRILIEYTGKDIEKCIKNEEWLDYIKIIKSLKLKKRIDELKLKITELEKEDRDQELKEAVEELSILLRKL